MFNNASIVFKKPFQGFLTLFRRAARKTNRGAALPVMTGKAQKQLVIFAFLGYFGLFALARSLG
jgi:hypothetical protein